MDSFDPNRARMTLTPRERIRAALAFQECDIVPIEARDVYGAPFRYPEGVSCGVVNMKGKRTDIWGCGWEALEDGVCGEVKYHPLFEPERIDSFSPPWEILAGADLSEVDAFCATTDRYVCPMWEPAMPNIFERMQFLRGTENLFMDLALGEGYVLRLRDKLQEYYLKQMEMWVATDIDAIHIADDWGSQTSLLVSPAIWREYFKPMYRQYCDLAHAHGKSVVMHSDGFVDEIVPDLIEIGVNALNLQIFCMDIEELARKYHHRIVFWGEIDRQHTQVFGTEEDMRQAVRRLSSAFFQYGRTGFVAQCLYTLNVPERNKAAEFDEWQKVSATWK